MNLTGILALLFWAVFAIAESAPVIKDSPKDIQYDAHFKREGFHGTISFTSFKGYVFCFGGMTRLPSRGLPYSYTIHQKNVPSDLNCQRTFGVLDPYDGERNAKGMADYKVGDLSGKHGAATTTKLDILYIDPYISLHHKSPSFIGDKSIVFVDSDGNRSVCASIKKAKKAKAMSKEMKEKAQKMLNELHLS